MLIDNKLLLRERFPAVRKYFLEHEKEMDVDHLEVIDSKAGLKTIRYTTENERSLMVHSLYDPIREAERLISSHQNKIESDTHVFFYGLGMGYHIEKFKQMFPNNSYSVYEPIPEMFLTMAQYKPIKQIITKTMKQLYVDSNEKEPSPYLEEFKTNNKNIHLVILPSYENIAEDKLDFFRESIKKVILNRRTSLHTNSKFQKDWVVNSLLNFDSILSTPNMIRDIDHKQFAGKPAMIVSAGPSLAEDMEHIRYIKENNLAYIFSVGSAINSLIANDVMPDAVCTYDPGKLNHKVFEKMIDKGINDIPMLFGSSVGYETLKNYQGPKVHFITTQDRTSTYFLKDQISVERDLIIDSPSIAVMAFQVLNKLGADPIIFAGQNLGYLNDRYYSEEIHDSHKRNLDKAIKTQDVYGNEVKTDIGLNNMRENIESFASLYKDKTLINTTKGGASIKGVPFQPIETVIKNKLNQSIEKTEWWNEQTDYDQSTIKKQQDQLKQSKSEFYDITFQFEKLLQSISSNIKIRNKAKVYSSLTKFDSMYNKLNKNIYYANFLSFYIRVNVQIMANEINRLNQESDPFDKGKEIVQLFSKFIVECNQEGSELEQIIEASMEQVERTIYQD